MQAEKNGFTTEAKEQKDVSERFKSNPTWLEKFNGKAKAYERAAFALAGTTKPHAKELASPLFKDYLDELTQKNFSKSFADLDSESDQEFILKQAVTYKYLVNREYGAEESRKGFRY